jgi:hypothetical protein
VFSKNVGRRELFPNTFPVTVAGLVLARLSPRVPGVDIFQKSEHLLGSGSGSSLKKSILKRSAASGVVTTFHRSVILLLPKGANY